MSNGADFRRKLTRWVAVIAVAAFIVTAAYVSLKQSAAPLQMSFVRDNGNEAIIAITNGAKRKFDLGFRSMILKDGTWQRAKLQPRIDPNLDWVGPHEVRTVAVVVPEEASRWRIELDTVRGDNLLEDCVEGLSKTFGRKISIPHAKLAAVLELEK